MGAFGEYLRYLREKSPYPTVEEFGRHCGFHVRLCLKWEQGEVTPSTPALKEILRKMPLSPEERRKLQLLWNRGRAASFGVDLHDEPPSLNVSEVAATIQREVEHELKRVGGIEVTVRTRRVCIARIELILKNALGKP